MTCATLFSSCQQQACLLDGISCADANSHSTIFLFSGEIPYLFSSSFLLGFSRVASPEDAIARKNEDIDQLIEAYQSSTPKCISMQGGHSTTVVLIQLGERFPI